MAQSWLYYIPILIQQKGRVGLTAKMIELDHAINSPEIVIELIDTLTAELAPDEPEEGQMPVVPLGWTLITARQGAGIKDNGDEP